MSAVPDRRGRPEPPADGPVPPDVLAAARAAFDVLDTSAAVAGLVSDSHEAGPAASSRVLVFADGDLQVTVAVDAPDGLTVQVSPASGAGVAGVEGVEVLVRDQEPPVVRQTASGHWSVTPSPHGPVSVAVRRASGVVRTTWTRL
jgi:hypothetical protein